jgi:hypothetical protein
MALFTIGSRGNPVTSIPHGLLLDEWKRRLEPLEIQAINIDFDRIIRRKKGGEICTAKLLSSDLSPSGQCDWEGSSFVKIWDKACRRDRSHTCWCFGLLLWEHMMNRSDAWHFEYHDLDSVPMAATRYYPARRLAYVGPSNETALIALKA